MIERSWNILNFSVAFVKVKNVIVRSGILIMLNKLFAKKY